VILFASLFAEWLLSPFTNRFRLFNHWKVDLSASRCRLPAYTFIEPRYFSIGNAVSVHRLAGRAPHGDSLTRRGGYRPREIEEGSGDNG
jgi:hypothetical protein